MIVAEDIKFDTDTGAATADKPFTIAFVNKDGGVPHDIEIETRRGRRVRGPPIDRCRGRVYSVPPLKAGTYTFVCKLHPNMIGTLTVK